MEYRYIDGQTPIDAMEKEGLIPNIVTLEDLNLVEQENILEGRKWLMQKSVLNRQNIFSEQFLIKLHEHMFGYVWKWAGKYRKTNKNIGVDKFHILTELKKLLGDAEYWNKNKTYDINELAVIFHHRLVKVHIFPNGNGRHARMVADAIVAKYNGNKLNWGGKFDLSKPNDIRKRYIESLREADLGNYKMLLDFCIQAE